MIARGLALRPSTTKYTSGNYYHPDGSYISVAGSAGAAGTLRLAPGYIRQSITVSSLSVRIGTAAAGGLFQIAVYVADPVSNLPTGAPIYTSASQSTTASGVIEVTGLTLSLPRGLYWFGVQADTTGAAVAFTSMAGTSQFTAHLVGMTTSTNVASPTGNVIGMSKSGTFGTWPTLTGNATTDSLNQLTSGSTALVAFKVV